MGREGEETIKILGYFSVFMLSLSSSPLLSHSFIKISELSDKKMFYLQRTSIFKLQAL